MFREFFTGLPAAAAGAYRGRFALAHLAAAFLTGAIVTTGLDWDFFLATRSDYLRPIVYLAGIGGFFVPVLVPIGLWAYGHFRGNVRARLAAIASAQAVIVAWCVSSFYKALTGRIEPEFLLSVDPSLLLDRSRTWHFGFLEYGIFWGWPSSHTAVAFAFAVALVAYAGRSRSLRFLAWAYAVCIGAGAAIGFHWLSDVLAGAIIGSVCGMAVVRLRRHKS